MVALVDCGCFGLCSRNFFIFLMNCKFCVNLFLTRGMKRRIYALSLRHTYRGVEQPGSSSGS